MTKHTGFEVRPGGIVQDSGIYEIRFTPDRYSLYLDGELEGALVKRATLVKGKRAPPGIKGVSGACWIQVVDTNPDN